MRVKGATLRSYLHWLQRERKVDEILARVPPSTAALLREPPLPGTWIDGMELVRLMTALQAVAGIDSVRRCGRETLQEMLPSHHSLITGLIRLFGTSPATVFAHADELFKTGVEGIHYRYTPTGERSGTMLVSYAVAAELPLCIFINGLSVLQLLFALVGVPGTVGEPERRGPTAAAYQLRW
jgi:hypothetical protein